MVFAHPIIQKNCWWRLLKKVWSLESGVQAEVRMNLEESGLRTPDSGLQTSAVYRSTDR
jgi:hypothetical protein